MDERILVPTSAQHDTKQPRPSNLGQAAKTEASYRADLKIDPGYKYEHTLSNLKRFTVLEPELLSGNNHKLRCEFWCLGCSTEFDIQSVDYWIEHSIAHFRHYGPPRQSSCAWCKQVFGSNIPDLDARNKSWEARMLHVASHVRDNNISPARFFQPDFYVLDHMGSHSIDFLLSSSGLLEESRAMREPQRVYEDTYRGTRTTPQEEVFSTIISDDRSKEEKEVDRAVAANTEAANPEALAYALVRQDQQNLSASQKLGKIASTTNSRRRNNAHSSLPTNVLLPNQTSSPSTTGSSALQSRSTVRARIMKNAIPKSTDQSMIPPLVVPEESRALLSAPRTNVESAARINKRHFLPSHSEKAITVTSDWEPDTTSELQMNVTPLTVSSVPQSHWDKSNAAAKSKVVHGSFYLLAGEFVKVFANSFMNWPGVRNRCPASIARLSKKYFHHKLGASISLARREAAGHNSYIVWCSALCLLSEIVARIEWLSFSTNRPGRQSQRGSKTYNEPKTSPEILMSSWISQADLAYAIALMKDLEFWQTTKSVCNFFDRAKQMYYDGSAKMFHIDNLITNYGNSGDKRSVNIRLDIDWNLRKFMATQYGADKCPKIGSIVAVTGSPLYCEATTCREYVSRNWPEVGPSLLSRLQDTFDGIVEHSQIHEGTVFLQLSENTKVLIKNTSRKSAIAVMQIMAWLGSVMRFNNKEEVQISTCETEFDGVTYHMRFNTSRLVEEEKLCWLGLFRNPLIADGFPIPIRQNDEVGLEAPIQILAALCGARSAVYHEGGLVLKGFSTALVPVKQEGKSVHWHLLTNENGKRMKYSKIQWPLRLPVSDFDHDSMIATRALLSWSESCGSQLGTQSINYGLIGLSKAKEASKSIRLTDFQLGFQNFGTMGLSFALGAKETPVFPGGQSRLERVLDEADELSICLYDVTQKRGWLVSGTETLLYMAHAVQVQRPYQIAGQPVALDFATVSCDGAHSCRNAIMKMASRPLRSNKETATEDYYVKDLISDYYSYLEIVEKDASEEPPGVAMKFNFHETLQGFELMDVARSRHKWRKKAVSVKSSHGGWPAMVRREQTPVLLGSNLGELLRPITKLRTPVRLDSLPVSKDFLAMTVCRLNMWFGRTVGDERLECPGIGVYVASRILERCNCDKDGVHTCPHLLRLLSKSNAKLRFLSPFRDLTNRGCIIIGQNKDGLVPSRVRATACNEQSTSSNLSAINNTNKPRARNFYEEYQPIPPKDISTTSVETVDESSECSWEGAEEISSPPTSISHDANNTCEEPTYTRAQEIRPRNIASKYSNDGFDRGVQVAPQYKTQGTYTKKLNRPLANKTRGRRRERVPHQFIPS
ncbi:hypothetical protein GLAREA_11893 [Glarea lozoyensis ATCC 20868]|uniref:Uncharacterized protein n=1 Tax=Glarea lozoyensis (strain ATCC 20868 / MF5171) TaxID=1116229 RepID=S3DIH8_GLAL2|nr:uncharacterized protein GLAREA_11893 [Glarea lozoyensis ATCC 20868]EPE31811.1 hypothetical protein GLAREA_11893 [Glarea lozoyensis ATCC 20868]